MRHWRASISRKASQPRAEQMLWLEQKDQLTVKWTSHTHTGPPAQLNAVMTAEFLVPNSKKHELIIKGKASHPVIAADSWCPSLGNRPSQLSLQNLCSMLRNLLVKGLSEAIDLIYTVDLLNSQDGKLLEGRCCRTELWSSDRRYCKH